MRTAIAWLGALFALAALAVVLWLDADDAPDSQLSRPADPARSEESSSVTGLGAAGEGGRTSEMRVETTWSVRVVDGDGSPLQDARIQASKGPSTMETTGQAEWSGVSPGTWTLVVTASALPVWRQEVEIAAGAAHTTIAELLPGVPVEGLVRDTEGRLQPGRIVGFVPGGERAPVLPARWLGLPHTRTAADGRFSLLLPEEGDWRLFVGWGGEVAFEEPAPTRLRAGGEGFVDVVVAAPTRLVVEVVDAPGVVSGTAHGVSVYREAQRLAADRAAKRMPRPPIQPSSPVVTGKDDESLLEEETVKRHEQEVERKASSPEEVRLRALRMAVVPNGWAKAKSGFCGANGRIEFERLPVDEELRFAVSRPPEAFAVDGSVHVPAGTEVRVKIELPAPRAESAPALAQPRRVTASIEPVTPGSTKAPGATWR